MRKLPIFLLTGFLLLPALGRGKSPAMLQLLARQKVEMKALKLKEKYRKASLRGPGVARALREQAKHEMQHEMRVLRERQKAERQKLKDRERIMRESMRQLPSE